MILIEYRDANWQVVARMSRLQMSRDEAVVVAQKYMDQMKPNIEAACVIGDEIETVVSRATEWQKRNG